MKQLEASHVSISRRVELKIVVCFTMEYYLAIKQKEPLTHRKTGMNFKNIMLSGRSQTQKSTV